MAHRTERGFCALDALSRYTSRWPPCSRWSRGKSARRSAPRFTGASLWSCRVPEPVEAVALEAGGELAAARLHDPAVEEDVDDVGCEVLEDPLVVGDEEDS